MSELGDRIRSAREAINLSQEELADRVGVSARTVGNWERGDTDPRKAIGKIERELGIILRGKPTGRDLPRIDQASPTQLIAQLADHIATRDARIHELEAQLDALSGGTLLRPRFAARSRDPEGGDQ